MDGHIKTPIRLSVDVGTLLWVSLKTEGRMGDRSSRGTREDNVLPLPLEEIQGPFLETSVKESEPIKGL